MTNSAPAAEQHKPAEKLPAEDGRDGGGVLVVVVKDADFGVQGEIRASPIAEMTAARPGPGRCGCCAKQRARPEPRPEGLLLAR